MQFQITHQPITFDRSKNCSVKDVSTGQKQHVSKIDKSADPISVQFQQNFYFILRANLKSQLQFSIHVWFLPHSKEKGQLILHAHTISILKRVGVRVAKRLPLV